MFDHAILLQGAATLLSSSVLLLAGACMTYRRDFGARRVATEKPSVQHITQLPRFA